MTVQGLGLSDGRRRRRLAYSQAVGAELEGGPIRAELELLRPAGVQ